MEYWFFCDESAVYDALKYEGLVVTLSRNAKSNILSGAYSHVFASDTLSLIDMAQVISADALIQLETFIKRYITKEGSSEMACEWSYQDLYYAAMQQSKEQSLAHEFFLALGANGGLMRRPGDELLITPSLNMFRHLNSYERQLPKNVWFHGSRANGPIENFAHGHYPAQAGFAGFGTVDVSRHAFFFSSDPRMSEAFGEVHAYEISAAKILDITADLPEDDAEKIRAAGFSPESIDRMHEKWDLFDGENGKVFCDGMLALGYDAVRYAEVDQSGVMRECMAALTASIIRHVTPDPLLVKARVNALALVDAWRDMYSQNRRHLSNEQIVQCLRDIGMKAGLQTHPGFYVDVQTALKNYDYNAVLNYVSALVVKDVPRIYLNNGSSCRPVQDNERRVTSSIRNVG